MVDNDLVRINGSQLVVDLMRTPTDLDGIYCGFCGSKIQHSEPSKEGDKWITACDCELAQKEVALLVELKKIEDELDQFGKDHYPSIKKHALQKTVLVANRVAAMAEEEMELLTLSKESENKVSENRTNSRKEI